MSGGNVSKPRVIESTMKVLKALNSLRKALKTENELIAARFEIDGEDKRLGYQPFVRVLTMRRRVSTTMWSLPIASRMRWERYQAAL